MKYICYSLLAMALAGCHRVFFNEKWIKEKAPEHFSVVFETSKGNIEAGFTREWSPLAVDRVYSQFRHRVYDGILFYRVKPNYVAQFGVDDSVKIKAWDKYTLTDEPVRKANERGTISFARSGKNTRNHDLYINLQNNSPRLDTIGFNGVKGFPVIGMVTKGMEVADSLYSGYGDAVFGKYDTLLHNKKTFLKSFPKLDTLKRVVVKKR